MNINQVFETIGAVASALTVIWLLFYMNERFNGWRAKRDYLLDSSNDHRTKLRDHERRIDNLERWERDRLNKENEAEREKKHFIDPGCALDLNEKLK